MDALRPTVYIASWSTYIVTTAMQRTQIYLGRESHRRLRTLAARRKTTVSHIIREAVDSMVKQAETESPAAVIKRVAGIWADRPSRDTDVRTLRKEWAKRETRWK